MDGTKTTHRANFGWFYNKNRHPSCSVIFRSAGDKPEGKSGYRQIERVLRRYNLAQTSYRGVDILVRQGLATTESLIPVEASSFNRELLSKSRNTFLVSKQRSREHTSGMWRFLIPPRHEVVDKGFEPEQKSPRILKVPGRKREMQTFRRYFSFWEQEQLISGI